MTFTAVTSTETFTGSDASAISGNFTQLRHLAYGSVARIKSNALAGHFANANAATYTDQAHTVLYRYTGAGSFSNDQYATTTVGNLNAGSVGANYRVGVGLRLDANTDAATTGYIAYLCDDNGGGSAGRQIYIVRLDGSALDGTTLDNRKDTNWSNGDTFTLGIQGSVLTVYRNGVATASTATDSTYTTGKPGIYLASDESGGTLSGPSADDWVGGNVTTVVPDSPLPRLSPVQLFGPILAQ